MLTLKEMAEKMNVGVSTVSAVLNDKEYCYISKVKRALIKKTAMEAGYIPNRMARGLKGLSTHTVGIVAPLFVVPIADTLIQALSDVLWEYGYAAMIGNHRHRESENRIIREFLSRGIDGLIIHTGQTKGDIERLLNGRVPCVFLNRDVEGCVTLDRRKGAFMAVEHLIVRHRSKKVGFVCTEYESNLEKIEGYKRALAEHRIRFKAGHCMEVDYSLDGADEAVSRILSLGLDSVLASSDFVAGYLIKQLSSRGIRVPDDIAVIGFDAVDDICNLVNPTLTSVRQPVAMVADSAVELLLKKIAGETPPDVSHYIEPSLKIGQSCGCGKGALVKTKRRGRS